MGDVSGDLVLPLNLADVDAAFMTRLLRYRGLIAGTNEVVSQVETDVGMTAGYFSAIKKIRCTYREPTSAPHAFVVKSWPAFELLPKDTIQAMFIRDISAYRFDGTFYPRPTAYLADYDVSAERWALIMEDADGFAVHKSHEQEMTFDDVVRMVPSMVDVAVAWEGADTGEKAEQLADLGVGLWSASENLGMFKSVMPGGAKLFDKLTTLDDSSLIDGPRWDTYLGGAGICELFTKRIDAFFAGADPARGATCTLFHGDLRGDNIFFCDPSPRYPDGWLCIDFQLMYRGPVPTDLAFMMSTATVLPEVYADHNLHLILRLFYDRFMARTSRYTDYTYDTFVREFSMMTAAFFVYAIGIGAAIFQASAFDNEQAVRVELGGRGATEADLSRARAASTDVVAKALRELP